jgi:hypothetical protein
VSAGLADHRTLNRRRRGQGLLSRCLASGSELGAEKTRGRKFDSSEKSEEGVYGLDLENRCR